MTCPRFAAVIINYKTPGLTLDCLASLEAEIAGFPGSKAAVVDNASADDSVVRLTDEIKRRDWGSWVEIIRSAQNRGFSAGNNIGVAALEAPPTPSGPRYDAYLLVNSDAILRAGALGEMANVLFSDPSTGIVGPQLQWPSGEIQPSCFRAISPTTELATAAKTGVLSRLVRGDLPLPQADVPQSSLPQSADGAPTANSQTLEWISFACVLIRATAFRAIGPMDEGFFMYFEDVDYGRRARQAGWRIAYAPQAHVIHLRGGRSPDEFALEELRRRPRFYESRSRYLSKYYGPTGPLRANALWMLGRGISLARELTGKKSPHTAAREAADIWTGTLCGFSRTFKEGREAAPCH